MRKWGPDEHQLMNLRSFLRLSKFLSKIVPYEFRELLQLCIFAEHLHQFLAGIAQRISQQEGVMARVDSQSVEQVMGGLFPECVFSTVLDAMIDHERLSLEALDNESKSNRCLLLLR